MVPKWIYNRNCTYGNILLDKLLSAPLESVGLWNNYWIKMNTSRKFKTPALFSGSQFRIFVGRTNLLTVFMFLPSSCWQMPQLLLKLFDSFLPHYASSLFIEHPIIHYISPSDHSMALGLTQPLVKMSTRNIPGDKGGRCVRLTTSPPSHAECHEIWEPKPPGTLWATLGL
jgi:hypothetical protein